MALNLNLNDSEYQGNVEDLKRYIEQKILETTFQANIEYDAEAFKTSQDKRDFAYMGSKVLHTSSNANMSADPTAPHPAVYKFKDNAFTMEWHGTIYSSNNKNPASREDEILGVENTIDNKNPSQTIEADDMVMMGLLAMHRAIPLVKIKIRNRTDAPYRYSADVSVRTSKIASQYVKYAKKIGLITESDMQLLRDKAGTGRDNRLNNMNVLNALMFIYRIMERNESEELLTQEEIETLSVMYGNSIPHGYPEDVKNIIKFLIAKGVYVPSEVPSLQSPITLGMYRTYLMRAVNKESRMVFHNIAIPYNKELIDKGYHIEKRYINSPIESVKVESDTYSLSNNLDGDFLTEIKQVGNYHIKGVQLYAAGSTKRYKEVYLMDSIKDTSTKPPQRDYKFTKEECTSSKFFNTVNEGRTNDEPHFFELLPNSPSGEYTWTLQDKTYELPNGKTVGVLRPKNILEIDTAYSPLKPYLGKGMFYPEGTQKNYASITVKEAEEELDILKKKFEVLQSYTEQPVSDEVINEINWSIMHAEMALEEGIVHDEVMNYIGRYLNGIPTPQGAPNIESNNGNTDRDNSKNNKSPSTNNTVDEGEPGAKITIKFKKSSAITSQDILSDTKYVVNAMLGKEQKVFKSIQEGNKLISALQTDGLYTSTWDANNKLLTLGFKDDNSMLSIFPYLKFPKVQEVDVYTNGSTEYYKVPRRGLLRKNGAEENSLKSIVVTQLKENYYTITYTSNVTAADATVVNIEDTLTNNVFVDTKNRVAFCERVIQTYDTIKNEPLIIEGDEDFFIDKTLFIGFELNPNREKDYYQYSHEDTNYHIRTFRKITDNTLNEHQYLLYKSEDTTLDKNNSIFLKPSEVIAKHHPNLEEAAKRELDNRLENVWMIELTNTSKEGHVDRTKPVSSGKDSDINSIIDSLIQVEGKTGHEVYLNSDIMKENKKQLSKMNFALAFASKEALIKILDASKDIIYSFDGESAPNQGNSANVLILGTELLYKWEQVLLSKLNSKDNGLNFDINFSIKAEDILGKIKDAMDKIAAIKWKESIDNTLTLILLYIVLILPRIAIFFLIMYLALIILKQFNWFCWFCKNVFDPIKIITFGADNYESFNNIFILLGTIAIAISLLALVSYGRYIQIYDKTVEMIFLLFK